MKLLLNGNSTEFGESLTLSALLVQYRLKPEAVVVEYNLRVPSREEYERIILHEGDRVEILKFMGGG